MAITGGPFQGTTVSDAQWALLLGMLARSGGLDGVDEAGHFLVSTSTGLTVSVAAGNAYAAGHFGVSDGAATVTLDAADANPRIDRIVLRFNMSAKTVTLAAVKGTPASTPTAPALTQNVSGTYELLLADVTVPALASALVSGNISDQRRVLAVDTNGVQSTDITDSTSIGRQVLTGASAAAIRGYLAAAAASHTHAAGDVNSGTLADARIPNLNASKITAGTLDAARIPNLPMSKISDAGTSGKAALAAANLAALRAASRIYVQSGTPSSPASGDLWFW